MKELLLMLPGGVAWLESVALVGVYTRYSGTGSPAIPTIRAP